MRFAILLSLFAAVVSAQSTDPKHPTPLAPGVNKGNVDNFGGPHYYYATVGPGHFDVKMAFKEMGLFGNPLRQGLNFDFKNEKGEMVSHNAIVSQGKIEHLSTTGDLPNSLKVILVLTAENATIRKGGYYEVEITGAVHFDAKTPVGAGAVPIDTSLVHPVGPLTGSGVELVHPGQALTASETRLELPMNLLFISGSNAVRQQAQPELHRIAELLRKAHAPIRIEGHTNSDIRLSEQRAKSVQAWLIANERFPAGAFTVQGFGDDQSGKRRIEFVFTK